MKTNLSSVLGDDDPLLGFDELCVALGPQGKPVCRKTISRWVNAPGGGIPHIRIGNRVFVKLSSLRQWLEARERKPNPRRERRPTAIRQMAEA